MHINTADQAAKALAGLQRKPVIKRIAKTDPCPDCGGEVINWYASNPRDPGDVDPRADCTNPDCLWGY
jgi:hypothetical protein